MLNVNQINNQAPTIALHFNPHMPGSHILSGLFFVFFKSYTRERRMRYKGKQITLPILFP